jgi:hypothetical protein
VGGGNSNNTNTHTLGHAQAPVNNSTCTLTDSASKTFSVTTGESGVATFDGNIATGLVSMVCNDVGTYIDEATGDTETATSLSAATNYTTGALTLIATPFSDAAVKLAGTPLSANAITTANANIAKLFGMDPNFVTIAPTTNSATISNPATSYDIVAIMLAGFSQLEQDATTSTASIIADLVQDLNDGDGFLSDGGIISKSSFTTALNNVSTSTNTNSTFAGVNTSVINTINNTINDAYVKTELSGTLAYTGTTTIAQGNSTTLTVDESSLTKGTGDISYTLTSTVDGVSVNSATGEITIGTTTVAGVHTITSKVESSHGGSATTDVSLTIIATPDISLNTTSVTVNSGTAITSIVPTNVNSATGSVDTWTITVEGNLPTGITFDSTTGTVSGTPSATLSATVFTITATNIAGNSIATFTMQVNLELSGTLAYTGTTTIAQGNSTTLTVDESSLTKGTGDISYTLTSTVDGVSVNSATGLITVGTITAVGSHTINVKVASSHGGSATTDVTIDIGNPPTINDFTATAYINATTDTVIGTMTFTNTPTITILQHAQGLDTDFNIDNNGVITVADALTNTTYVLEVQAQNNFGSDIATLTVNIKTVEQLAKMIASDGASSDYFGYSVAIDNNYMIIGAYGDDNNTGSAYLFSINTTTGAVTQTAKLTASDGAADDYFGRSVAIDNNYMIIGAYRDDDDGSSSGSAYLFSINTTTGAATQTAKLTASDGAAGDSFGISVAIDNNYAVIGAYRDDDNGNASGSAYLKI